MNDTKYPFLLAQYNNFSECLLLNYWSEDFCRTFVLLIGSIWGATGKMHPQSEFVELASLVFGGCRKIEINNVLPQDVLDYPETATWGISEFALIKVEAVDNLFQFQILWESDRYITILCQDFSLRPVELTDELREKYHDFLE